MEQRKAGLSQELDELSSALVGDALDFLAEGADVGALLVVEDASGCVGSYEFGDDEPEALVEGARARVRSLARKHGDPEVGLSTPVRYALVYEGLVADENGVYRDALLLEFGEKGWKAYSAYSFYEGKGRGDQFAWTEPAPAGEIEPLL